MLLLRSSIPVFNISSCSNRRSSIRASHQNISCRCFFNFMSSSPCFFCSSEYISNSESSLLSRRTLALRRSLYKLKGG
ncbi:hypothetical protein DCAR_0831184 [Daucus carota subsp. sativus]|uniref:Uncharacterized protein n=1 Tax=Daucus carota subsp. sativus TaxID=79200 RepID=A0AAF0XS12_DAUCS|nr:hypothetical protein DCAR_0831184 [Daucus carota subsp. sativus]